METLGKSKAITYLPTKLVYDCFPHVSSASWLRDGNRLGHRVLKADLGCGDQEVLRAVHPQVSPPCGDSPEWCDTRCATLLTDRVPGHPPADVKWAFSRQEWKVAFPALSHVGIFEKPDRSQKGHSRCLVALLGGSPLLLAFPPRIHGRDAS